LEIVLHESGGPVQERSFTVSSISCHHCTMTIRRELGELPGVRDVEADAVSKRVRVRWDEPASWNEIHGVLTEIGFPPDEG